MMEPLDLEYREIQAAGKTVGGEGYARDAGQSGQFHFS
jgi:hypothetical protein